MKKFFYIGVACYLFFGCSSKNEKGRLVFDQKSQNIIQAIKIEYLEVVPISILADGFFRVKGEQIYFFDTKSSKVHVFDKQGTFIEEKLGKGNGPSEIPLSFIWHTFVGNDNVFMGRQSDIYFFDSDFVRIETKIMQRPPTKEYYDKYDKNDPSIYILDLVLGASMGSSNMLPVDSKNNFFVPLRILDRYSPSFNLYTSSYYDEAFIAGVFNMNSGELENWFGHWPKRYQNGILPHMDNRFFTIKSDSILIGFNASEEIQVYSPYPELKFQYSFGVKPDSISDDYKSVRTPDEISEYRSKQGIYTHVYYDSIDNMVFRSYFKSKESQNSGIQVYKDKQLIAEFSTPKHFNVIGKIDDLYYADGYMDEQNDKIGLYRFRLSGQ